MLEQVIPDQLLISANKSELKYEIDTGKGKPNSEFWCAGLERKAGEQYPQKIGSTSFNCIFIDEGVELDKGDYEFVLTRARYNPTGISQELAQRIPKQVFTATNPSSPNHHLHKRFIESQDPSREVYYMTPKDNPYLGEKYMSFLDSLTGIQRERLYEGKWVQAEGIIYDFEPRRHVMITEDMEDLTNYQHILVGIDSNYPKPRAAVIIGKAGNEIHVINEYYVERSQPESLGEWLKQQLSDTDAVIEGYHDPADQSAKDTIEETSELPIYDADNDVNPGITTVAKYFAEDTEEQIRIHPRCENLIEELNNYRWKDNVEEPIKENDHLCDSLRYAIHTDTGEAWTVLSGYDTS